MSRRPLAVLAAGTALGFALSPTFAHAQTVASSPRVATHPGTAGAPAPAAASHTSVGAETSAGITPELTYTATGARSFVFDSDGSGDSSSTITGYTFDYGDGSTVSGATDTVTHTYARPGEYTVTVTITDAAGNTATDSVTVTTLGSEYTPYGPTRVLDTRAGTGEGGTAAKLGANSSVRLQIAGNGAIPADATAVVINLTTVNETGGGYISAGPDGAGEPETGLLYYNSSQITQDLATVAVGADGYIDLYNSGSASTDLIGDVSGYYTSSAADGYTPLTPTRILDTRTAVGGHDSAVPADGTVTLTVAGADNGALPGSGIAAVVLNLTATGGTKGGYISAYPDGAALPNTSNLDYTAGQTVAGYAIVPVGADGKIDLYNSSTGTAELIADVSGYFSANSANAYVPLTTPTRTLDTRTQPGGSLCAECTAQDSSLNTGNGVTAYAVNTTVTGTAAAGYAVIYPAGTTASTAADIYWTAAGQTTANADYAAAGGSGVSVANESTGTANFIVDEYGYFATN